MKGRSRVASMFAMIRAVVLMTMVYQVASGPAFESNPFLQVPATSKAPHNQKTNPTDVYVVLPSTGQQLQHSSGTVQPSTLSSPVPTENHVHTFNCFNGSSSTHVHSQESVANTQVQQSSNWNSNVASTAQTVVKTNTPELNRRCLKSTGLFLGTSCDKFVTCVNGTATELNCPDGLVFNAQGLYCDRPENVECNGQTSAAALHHVEPSSTLSSAGSPIHASLVQFSAIPPQQVGQTEQVSAGHPSQVQLSDAQQQLQQQLQHQQQQQAHQSSSNANSFVETNKITGVQENQQHHQQQHQHNQLQQNQHQHNQQQVDQQQHHEQQHNQQQSHQQQQHYHHQQQQHYHHQQENQQQQHYQQQHHQQQNQQHQQIQQEQQQHQHQQQHHQQQTHQEQQHQQQFNQEHQHQQQQHQQQFNQEHQHHQQQQQQHQHQQHQQQFHQQQSHQEQHQEHNQQHQLHLSGVQPQQQQQIFQGALNGNPFLQTPISAQQNVPVTGLPVVNIGSILETNEISGSGSDTRCVTLRGQFASNACHTFLNCWGGVATEQACPDGLLFSTKGYCDYPENVNCAGRLLVASQPIVAAPIEVKSPPPSSPTTQSPTPTSPTLAVIPTTSSTPTATPLPTVVAPQLRSKCLTARGQFPSTSCNKFVNCWDNIILEQECPEGYLFSTKGYCDFSHNVYCGDRPLESRGVDVSSKSECPLENGTFRDKNKCSSYFTCVANKIVAKYECPDGLNYNDYLGVCDYSYRVDCSLDPLLIPGRSNKNPVVQLRRGDECPADFATYRDVNNCGVYYTCVSKTIVATYECPAGFSFNDEIGICDYSERVDCTKAPKIFQVPKNVLPQVSNDMKQKIETCTPGTMFSLNPQCTAVCLCRSGVAEIVQCPAGLAYDSKMDKCILPHLAKC